MDSNIFNDLIASCNEAIECEKGILDLKSNEIEFPDYIPIEILNQQTIDFLINPEDEVWDHV